MCPGWAGGGMTVLLLRRAVRDGPGRGAMEAFQAYGAGCPGVPACLMCSNLLGDQLVEVKVELPLLSHGHAARAGAPAFSVLCTHLQDGIAEHAWWAAGSGCRRQSAAWCRDI